MVAISHPFEHPGPAAAVAAPLLSPDDSCPGGDHWPVIPRYILLDVLGRGGMGVVYQAWDIAREQIVALKVPRSGRQAGAEEQARFRTEAEALARLPHPQVVQIYEIGEHEGRPFLALEYIDGNSLAQELAGEPQSVGPAAWLVKALAEVVHFAHCHGVIHRDLKPANILLISDGIPVLTDFGLARLLDESGRRTEAGQVLGTPGYIPPEQARGENTAVGPAADVYALGAILYKVLTGRPPFKAATVAETLTQVLHREPVPPRRLQPQVPHDLEAICLQCLQRSPDRRYASAQELADDLGRFLDGRPVQPWRSAPCEASFDPLGGCSEASGETSRPETMIGSGNSEVSENWKSF